MEVVIAGSEGFCYGVKRALDKVTESARTLGRPMFTLGPLIHNPQVIERLGRQGVRCVQDVAHVPPGAVLVMPSHGVARPVAEQSAALGIETIDVTCPFVAKVHQLADELVADGYQVVILGDEGHTEVKGILSRAGDDAIAVPDVDDLPIGKFKKRVGVLAQTTQTVERYSKLVSRIAANVYEVRAYNTICNATSDRQKSAMAVAAEVDVMVVVGGRNSANTKRLAEVCSAVGIPTHQVEIADELHDDWFRKAAKVGVTAGASTPDWIIKEVVERIEHMPPTK